MTIQSRFSENISTKSIRKISVAISALLATSLVGGCATTPAPEVQPKPAAIEKKSQAKVGEELLPPNARPGECYARVWVEPVYVTKTKEVLVKEAGERIDVTPAKYGWGEDTVEVSAASTRLIETPATYGTETESVLVQAATREWLTDKKPSAAPASKEVLERARTHGINLDSAKPGMCFHEHYLPAGYRETMTEVEISPASEEISIIPAKYRIAEKRVLIKEASQRVVEVPAVYETVTERIIDKPAHTVWKKGTGPVQKINEATGEIMCLVDVPATYKTITKRVIKTPATTRVIEIPAEYKTEKVRELVSAPQEVRKPIPARYKKVKGREKIGDGRLVWHEVHDKTHPMSTRTGAKICLIQQPAKYKNVTRRVIKTHAATRTVEIPARHKTIKVRKLVSSPQEKRIEIPAKYKTVTLRELKEDGHMEWRSILCEVNMTPGRVVRIQKALKKAGFDPGPIDGNVGGRTMAAVNAFQKAKGLPVDRYLNAKTVKALGVSLK
uniref:Peptidoglycan binding domain-containing protein n=1 Tax=Candidatus Kentrum sp. UNK TaxID=2126344 RepID=A0A451AIL5_9GAMM|nr:MAG: Putative peptidoglycan binding domain-containing protein [Candidatus Kentron sp. UNK]VFK71580.1 MAG: Putative peptidoglycan binding domain-containing protein [Candidatus Kentron sp. UNK]